MSKISTLTLSESSPRQRVSLIGRKRRKLIEQLVLQKKAAEAAVSGSQFFREVHRWQHVEGKAEKQLVASQKLVRPWWWQNDFGKILLSLRQGSRIIEVAAGKASIEVGDLAALPEVLQTLREAVADGELDGQLAKGAPSLHAAKKAKATKN